MSNRTDHLSSAPKVARVERQLATKRVIDRALVGENITQIALNVGVSDNTIDGWRREEKSLHISVADAAAMPLAIRLELCRFIMGEGYDVTEIPVLGDIRAELALAIEHQRDASTVTTEHLDAIKDGKIDRAEGARVETACDRLIRSTLAVREVARQARREGVIGCDLRVVGR